MDLLVLLVHRVRRLTSLAPLELLDQLDPKVQLVPKELTLLLPDRLVRKVILVLKARLALPEPIALYQVLLDPPAHKVSLVQLVPLDLKVPKALALLFLALTPRTQSL